MAQPSNDASEEKKEEESNNPSVCHATQNYDAKHKLKYIEKDTFLSDEHTKLWNELRLYVDNVLQKKEPWTLSILPPRIVALVDANPEAIKQKEDEYNKQKNNNNYPKQKATEEMYVYLSKWATDATIIRAITGADYRLDIAKVAILETVQWRVSSQVDKISPDMFEKAISTKVVYSMNQRDKQGHIICYFKVLDTPPEDPWMIVRAAIWTIVK